MKKQIKPGFMLVFFLLAAVACSPEPTYSINGLVEGHNGFPVVGALVQAPGCGSVKIQSDTGFFHLKCVSGEVYQVVRVSGPGFAPSIRVLPPVDNMVYSLVIPVGMKLKQQEFDIQSGDQAMNISTRGFSVTSDAAAFELTKGKVTMSVAYWDSLFQNKAVMPFVGGLLGEDGKRLKVLPVAVGYFSVTDSKGNQIQVSVHNEARFEAVLTGADMHNTNFNSWSTENKLYHFEPDLGWFVEKPFEGVDKTSFSMRFTGDETGFWMWAKPMVHPSCMEVELAFPNGKGAAGAQVDLNQKYFTQQALGSKNGTTCIDSEGGYVVSLTGSIVTPEHVLTAHRDTLTFPTKPGSCDTGCPGHITLTFQCESDADCKGGYACQGGQCVKP